MFKTVERITVENDEGKKFAEGDSVVVIIKEVNTIRGEIYSIDVECSVIQLSIEFSSDTDYLELSCEDITDMHYVEKK